MLYPVSITSYSNQLQPQLKSCSKKGNIVKTENALSDNMTVYSNIAKNYAITSPNFKATQVRNKSFELELTDEPTTPIISIELNNCDKISAKSGMRMIHKIVLNDIMADTLSNMPEIDSKESYIQPSSIKVDLKSSETDFYYSLLAVNEKLLKFDIDEYFLKSAKNLAPVAYLLNQRAGEYEGFFDDIPKGISEEDYTKIINDISLDDLKEYHNNLFKNSDINIKLKMNKDFYKHNKDNVDESIRLINEKAGN